jgi:glyoxylase-like metal-dependent hydrolase (beta-lactamase superfamily II)
MGSGVELATYPGLDDRVVVLRAGEIVDAVFVRTERFNVLIDTLDTPETCHAALALLGQEIHERPQIVVNSHMDWDHFWGNSVVAGKAIIIAHEKALQRFREPSVGEVLQRKAAEDARFKNVELCPPTVTFSDRLRLDGGDLTLELFSTPGHTPDHIAVWIPELRTCLAIDAVEDPIPEVWSDDPEDLRSLVASLRLIEGLDAEHVVLAHGQTNSPSVVRQNIRYFETLAERVRQFDWTDGVGDEGAIPKGLELLDITPVSASLSPEARSFYECCHRSNLRAAVRSFRESVT